MNPQGDRQSEERVLREIAERLERIESFMGLVRLLLAQNVDVSHLSVAAAAKAMGVSVKTVRRRIAAGSLRYDTIPGSTRRGIPVDELYDGGSWWIPLTVARRIIEQERSELHALQSKSR